MHSIYGDIQYTHITLQLKVGDHLIKRYPHFSNIRIHYSLLLCLILGIPIFSILSNPFEKCHFVSLIIPLPAIIVLVWTFSHFIPIDIECISSTLNDESAFSIFIVSFKALLSIFFCFRNARSIRFYGYKTQGHFRCKSNPQSKQASLKPESFKLCF